MHDPRVLAGDGDLGLRDEDLVHLLARPQPGEHDVDIRPKCRSALGQVDDLHRLAHVEDHHLAGRPMAPACSTSRTASGIVMK